MDFDFDFDVDNHKKISDLPDELQMSTESFNEKLMDEEHVRAYWGNEKYKLCGGDGQSSAPLPDFSTSIGKDGIVYVHLYGGRPNDPLYCGKLYQLLMSIPEGVIVHFHIHGIVWYHTVLIQTAIKECKGEVHTFLYMCEPSPMDACMFFAWMMGKVLEPIPHDIIGLIEPYTIFDTGYGSTENKRNSMAHDSSIKQGWYDYAMDAGILTVEDISRLNNGEGLTIQGINSRIDTFNRKQGLTT